jgi:hypothetical protein
VERLVSRRHPSNSAEGGLTPGTGRLAGGLATNRATGFAEAGQETARIRKLCHAAGVPAY